MACETRWRNRIAMISIHCRPAKDPLAMQASGSIRMAQRSARDHPDQVITATCCTLCWPGNELDARAQTLAIGFSRTPGARFVFLGLCKHQPFSLFGLGLGRLGGRVRFLSATSSMRTCAKERPATLHTCAPGRELADRDQVGMATPGSHQWSQLCRLPHGKLVRSRRVSSSLVLRDTSPASAGFFFPRCNAQTATVRFGAAVIRI